MWRPWSKSPVRIHNSSAAAATALSATSTTNNFSCSTFKDIQNLCSDEPSFEPHISRKPSVFHRVRAATSLVRSWSSSSRQLLQSNSCSPPPQFHHESPQQHTNNADPPETSESQPFSNSTEISEKNLTTSEPIEPNAYSPETTEQTSVPEPDSNAEAPETSSENNIVTRSAEEPDPPNATTTTSAPPPPPPSISLPGTETRIVVYFTSLRVVRPTFEACRAVRSIIRGFRVSIDERDLSMDSGFLEELQRILGETAETTKLRLPRVFIGGRYIGGAEEIQQLHEAGELKKFVEGLPAVEPGVCDACGGYSFLLCDECNGSHKLYTEKNNGFRSCTACNENGLIRCPSCSCAPF